MPTYAEHRPMLAPSDPDRACRLPTVWRSGERTVAEPENDRSGATRWVTPDRLWWAARSSMTAPTARLGAEAGGSRRPGQGQGSTGTEDQGERAGVEAVGG